MDAQARDAMLAAGRVELLRLPLTTPERDVLVQAINLAEAVTESRIGYLHYVNDDQDTIELAVWSDATTAQCAVVSDRHYPISAAGVWAETFWQRAPVIHNDYAALPFRRGLPSGHAPLSRHLGVAVVADGGVRMLMGVGNKVEPYDARDVEAAQQVADDTWLLVRRLRELHEATETLSLVRSQRRDLRLCTWEWDPDTDRVQWGPSVDAVLGGSAADPGFTSWRPLLDELDHDSRDQLSARLREGLGATGLDLDLGSVHTESGPRTFRISGGWSLRSTGSGQVMRGVLVDTSVVTELGEARYAAQHDPLTGLLNRAGLLARLEPRLAARRLRSWDEFAVHFIDLDAFKRVNDEFGHLAGDTVLRVCAQRLIESLRSSDIAARLGGDEFVVIQDGGPDPAEIEALARKLIARICEPIPVDGRAARVGASIGVARSSDSLPGVEALLRRADAALYEAKARGCGLVIAGSPDPG